MSEHMRGFFKFPASNIETYTYATLLAKVYLQEGRRKSHAITIWNKSPKSPPNDRVNDSSFFIFVNSGQDNQNTLTHTL